MEEPRGRVYHSEALQPAIPPEFDIERFVRIQDQLVAEWPLRIPHRTEFERALQELRNGRMISHWMWFIFPQVFGLGKSANSRFYGIKSAQEAVRYLAHPILGPRLRTAGRALIDLDVKDLGTVLGNERDVAKVNSCLTLFATMSFGNDSVFFMRLLDKLWNGRSCGMTLRILDSWAISTTGSSGVIRGSENGNNS